jgi:hypothetical protein
MSIQTQHFKPKTCPNCQQTNAALALFCVQCGAALPAPDENPMVMADLLAARLKTVAQQVSEAYQQDLQVGSLVLYIPAEDAAIVLKQTDKLVLGRTGASAGSTHYDLSAYNAYLLGVSRRHATVSYTPQGYTMMDMGSANGTWVNSRRLTPHVPHVIKNGDQIWLGQLILLAYTNAPLLG